MVNTTSANDVEATHGLDRDDVAAPHESANELEAGGATSPDGSDRTMNDVTLGADPAQPPPGDEHSGSRGDAETVAEVSPRLPEAGPTPSDSQEDVPRESGDTVARVLREFRGEIAELRATFDEKIRYDASRETIIDRLHAEVQQYKGDVLLKMLKPLVLGLISLHDDMGKVIEAYRAESEPSEMYQKLLSLLGDFQADTEDILDRNGFASFVVPDSKFDPKCQRAVKRVPTDDPQLDHVVAERVRKGFVYEDRVIRPEMVAVYVYEKQS